MDNNSRSPRASASSLFRGWIIIYILLYTSQRAAACVFHSRQSLESESEGVRFIRIREDLHVGGEVLTLRAYPRNSIHLKSMERSSDHSYFRLREVNSTTIQVLLEKSLQDLVDRDTPQNLLKFKIVCTSNATVRSEEQSFMAVTVYIEDTNDHFPTFLNLPYNVEVDELTPVGSTVFQNIAAFDRDKPNTPNSDIQYSIGMSSPSPGYFTLESPHRPSLILRKPLDYDEGIKSFNIEIIASDRGNPPRSSNTTMKILIKDNDDLPPKFTHIVYRSALNEFSPITGKSVHIPLVFDPPIRAYDQDSINATLAYNIIAGNDRQLFLVQSDTGVIFLEKEIDLEEENLQENTFVLHLEVRQIDNSQRRSVARLEIEILDVNDNSPEFEVDLYNISIVENLPTGFSVLQVSAIDRDQGANAEFYYWVADEKPPGTFSVDQRTGWITVKNQTLLDRELRPVVRIMIQAVEKLPSYNKRTSKDGTVHVEITLLDANDNTPKYVHGNLYEFKVSVQAKLGHVVGHIDAKDPDEGPNGLINYEFQKSQVLQNIPFSINPQNGTIYVSGALRRGRLALFVEASDQPKNPSERRFSLAVVTIEIVREDMIGVLDFIGAPYEFWIGENVPVGTSVGQIKTTLDNDQPGESIMYDLLHSYPDGVPFAVEERTGTVTVIKNLNEFSRKQYEFEAVASNDVPADHNGLNGKHTTSWKTPSSNSIARNVIVTNVTLNIVSNVVDQETLLRGTNTDPIIFRIKENMPNAKIGQLIYNKNLTRSKEKLQYAKHNNIIGIARINRQLNSTKFNGKNQTQFGATTRSKRNLFLDNMYGKDLFYVPIASTILYEDVENPLLSEHPSFKRERRSTNVRETLKNYLNVSLEAPDTGEYEEMKFTRKRYRNGKVFETKRSTKGVLTKENRTEAVQNGLRFIIANQQDVVDLISIGNDGTLRTVQGLDREQKDRYYLTVIAEYTNGHFNAAGIYQVIIQVDDVNDNAPEFNQASYIGVISENSPIGTEIILNKAIIVTDKDIGYNADIDLALSGQGSHLFQLQLINRTVDHQNVSIMTSFDTFTSAMNIVSGFNELYMMFMDSTIASMTNDPHYIIKYIGPTILDRERVPFYNLTITAKDKGLLSTSAKLGIFIADVNDNAPVFEKLAIFQGLGIEILEYTNGIEIYYIDVWGSKRNSDKPKKITTNDVPEVLAMPNSYGRNPAMTSAGNANGHKGHIQGSNESPLFALLENSVIGNPVMMLSAKDDDYNNQIHYHIVSELLVPRKLNTRNSISTAAINFFNIDQSTGEIRVNSKLPAECDIRLNISAKDVGNLTDYFEIRFRIVDINDHRPVFFTPWYSFDIEEGLYKNSRVGRVEAVDEDYGQNANVTYEILSAKALPFQISQLSGVITINGEVDRELQSTYIFKVKATDNSEEKYRLSSEVDVEITVLDINDNAPEFMAFDQLVRDFNDTSFSSYGIPPLGHTSKSGTPIYKVSLSRHNEPGTFVKQVIAVDKDYPGNGNGLVMYSLYHYKTPHLFEIDSREGIITTLDKWNYIHGLEHFYVTIIASDLGSPSRSSMALLLVNLQIDEKGGEFDLPLIRGNLLEKKFIDIRVLENSHFQSKILQFNLTSPFKNEMFKWEIISDTKTPFFIDEFNGTLFTNGSLDREHQDYYELYIRVTRKLNSPGNVTLETQKSAILQELLEDEAKVIIRITDENDNSPTFIGNGRPIVAVIPSTANFGYPVTTVVATDPDLNENADIRYSLLNEPYKLFGIDPVTGHIRVLGPLSKEIHRVYGFDVKATDRRGADDGKSSITNVFVYILDENRQVKLVLMGNPLDVEREVDQLGKSLSDATNLDVRVRMLEPHSADPEHATDVYIYAVDPRSNSLINMGQLQKAVTMLDMASLAVSLPIIEVAKLETDFIRPGATYHSIGINGPELATIILSVVILAGGLATAFCIACVRYKRKIFQRVTPQFINHKSSTMQSNPSSVLTPDTISERVFNSPKSRPVSAIELYNEQVISRTSNRHTDAESSALVSHPLRSKNIVYLSMKERRYIDVPLPKAVRTLSTSTLNVLEHDSSCLRFNQGNDHQQKRNMDFSVHSIHSSGRDSGLDLTRERSESPSAKLAISFKNKQTHREQNNQLQKLKHREMNQYTKCMCVQKELNICSESSDSYEDSLKGVSISRRSSLPRTTTLHRSISINNKKRGRGNRHSFSGVRDDLIQQSPPPLHRAHHGQFKNSITDLEDRLRHLERSFRDPYNKSNSHC